MTQCLLLLLCLAMLGVSAAEARGHAGTPAAGRSDTASVPNSVPVAPPLVVQVEPADVTLERGHAQQLIVVAHNPRAVAVDKVELNFLLPDGVTADIKDRPSLPAVADMIWRISLKETESAPQVAKLIAQLSYIAKGGAPRVELATVTVTQAPVVDLSASLKALVVSGEISLDEVNEQPLVVDFHNTGRETVSVGSYEILAPAAYVQLAVPLPSMDVPPGEDKLAKLTLKMAPEGIMPGKYALVLGYNITAPTRPNMAERSAVQSPITLSVPGVSDVMQLIGVPSLLLLPGALTVVAFITTFSWFSSVIKFDWKDPRAILIAISLSIFYPIAYPWAVSHLIGAADKTSYLHAYNLSLVTRLWFGSCLLGFLCGLVVGLVFCAISAWRKWLVEPDGRDKPMDVLRKLAWHGADFNLERLRRRPSAAGDRADPDVRLALPFGRGDGERRWVVKRASAQRPAHSGQRPADDARAQALLDLLGRRSADRCLTRRLYFETWIAVHRKGWTLQWEREGGASGGPTTVASAEYEALGEFDTFLICK
jgi:hypothetical protein